MNMLASLICEFENFSVAIFALILYSNSLEQGRAFKSIKKVSSKQSEKGRKAKLRIPFFHKLEYSYHKNEEVDGQAKPSKVGKKKEKKKL